MRIHYFRHDSPLSKTVFKKPLVLILGYFEILHSGHRELLKKAFKIAKKTDYSVGIITFDAPPHKGNLQSTRTLLSLEDRLSLFRMEKIDEVFIINFTQDFRHLSWQEFIANYLEDLPIRHLVCGSDFRFGYKAAGKPEDLQEKYDTAIVPLQTIKGKKIATSDIRLLISQGDFESANKILLHPYRLSAIVEHGNRIGRELGFPTANLKLLENYHPIADGVYVARLVYKKTSYWGVMSIGTNPTINQQDKTRYEIYILDFNQQIYHEYLKIDIFHQIRCQIKFESVSELISRIKKDVESTRNFAKEYLSS